MGTRSSSDSFGTASAPAPGGRSTNVFNSVGLGGRWGSPKLRIPYPNIGGLIKSASKNRSTFGGNRTSAPAVVSQSAATPKPYDNSEDTRIGNARHANADFYAQVNQRLAQLNSQKAQAQAPVGGSSPSGGGGSLNALASLNLSAASNPYDRALSQLGVDYGNNRKAATLQGKRQDADLGQLFSRLSNYEDNLKKNQEGNYRLQGQHIYGAYDKLAQDIQNSFKQGAGNTTNELQRLGIQEVSPSAMAGLASDASHLTNQSSIDKLGAIANNNANSNTFRSLMNEMMGSAVAEGTSQRGKARQATADSLSALLQQYAKDRNDLSGKKADALLQARMANLKASISARSSAGKMSPFDLFKAKEEYKAAHGTSAGSKPKYSAYDAAMTALQGASGNDPNKFQDLRQELDFINSNDWKTNNAGGKDLTPMTHLNQYWGDRTKYGPQGINALLQALATLNKK